ncbi:MAG TPA: LPXTG cell wall anchor domain-containing protein [Acidimicrobiales bacterium]
MGPRPGNVIGAGVLLIAALVVLGGCRVDTRVSVVDRGGGHGTVSVTATFDSEAVQALGGETGLARQLSVTDLTAAGWVVNGPVTVTGGGATVTVRHGYSSPSEASRVFADLAGSGPASNRPFKLTLTTQRGLLHVHDSLSGRIDLSCGLSCFGDQGLQSALGYTNGVSTAPLLQTAGRQPGQVFGFAFTARMPGSLQSDNAASRDRSDLTWSTPLGQATQISAESETLNTGNIVLFSVIAGLVIVGLGALVIFRRRRRSGRGSKRGSGGGSGRGSGRGSGGGSKRGPGRGSGRAKHVRRRRIWPFRDPARAS